MTVTRHHPPEGGRHIVETPVRVKRRPFGPIDASSQHLPVIDTDAVAAVLTIDELVRHRLDSLHEELQHLKDYISDLHEAGRD